MNLNQNYFELFGLTSSFCLDGSELLEKYRRIQQQIHPDRFADGSDQEKRLSLQYTVFVNEAYRTLTEPLSRAIYMLELGGREIRENQPLDPSFLMQQMELREQLEDIETDHQSESDALGKLDCLKEDVEQLQATLHEQFGEVIDTVMDKTRLDRAEALVYQMQYTKKLLQEISRVEDKLMEY